jgi:hypothetical protein
MSLPAGVNPTNLITTQRYGIILALASADSTLKFEIQRAPDSAGAPGTWVTIAPAMPGSSLFYIDPLPNDNVIRWYRHRHVGLGFDPSDWSTPVSGTPLVLFDLAPLGSDLLRQAETFFIEDNVLSVDVRQRAAGSSAKRLARGTLFGTGKNGDTVTFPTPMSAPPMVIVIPGITYEPRAGSWTGTYNAALPQYVACEALDVSLTGFLLRARLYQKGTRTARTHNFGASNDLNVIDESAALTLSNAPSADDFYIVHYSVSLTVTCNGLVSEETHAELVVAVETMTDGTNWVPREYRAYEKNDFGTGGSSVLTVAHEKVRIGVTGVDSSDQVRVRIVSLTLYGADGTATYSVHAFDGTSDPDSGVTYETGTDVIASMTPDSIDHVNWRAIEVVA